MVATLQPRFILSVLSGPAASDPGLIKRSVNGVFDDPVADTDPGAVSG